MRENDEERDAVDGEAGASKVVPGAEGSGMVVYREDVAEGEMVDGGVLELESMLWRGEPGLRA